MGDMVVVVALATIVIEVGTPHGIVQKETAEVAVVMAEEVAVEAEVEVVTTAIKMGTWPEIVQRLTVAVAIENGPIHQFVCSCLVIRCPDLVCWFHRQCYSSMESCSK